MDYRTLDNFISIFREVGYADAFRCVTYVCCERHGFISMPGKQDNFADPGDLESQSSVLNII